MGGVRDDYKNRKSNDASSDVSFKNIVPDSKQKSNPSDENFSNVEEDGTEIDCYMNIDVKENDSGNWFYSFAIEKGTAPRTLLAGVTEESATVPEIIIPDSEQKINPSDENFSNDGKTGEIEAKKGEIEIPYSRKRATGAVKSNVDIKENTGYNVNETNFSKKGSTKSEKENDKDSGILEGRVLSAVSESKDNQWQRSNDTENIQTGVARNGDTSRYDTGSDSYRKNVSGYLARTDFVSPGHWKRYQKSILRGLEGKLADRDSSGRRIPQEIKEKFKNTASL